MQARGLDDADVVYVQPAPHCGAAALAPLQRDALAGAQPLPRCTADLRPAGGAAGGPTLPSWLPSSPVRFVYQSMTFHLVEVVEEDAPAVAPTLAFAPLSCPDRAALSAYAAWPGWNSHAQVEAARAKWGANAVESPPPTFLALLREQALAPFFAFQMFSVSLWMLDEYWQYALYSLSMLLAMEALQAFQRLQQHGALRSMRPAPSPVHRLRQGMWARVAARELLPGDVISLSSEGMTAAAAAAAPTPGAAAVVPADCVLIAGSAVVNEAMLTGESAPVLKDALASAADLAEPLNAFLEHGSRSHSRHIAFAGTTLLQTSAAGEGEAAAGGSAAAGAAAGAGAAALPPPPDGGALAVVVRTGYQTSQGDLMRTIAHASQKVSAGNWEAFAFIAGLLVFAIISATYVLREGWAHPRHNKYKLVLHCIMIMTSVVPPELPIELALAINASLATLARRGIFCTEPFRVVFGGMVDVCVFDKTGTLTSDEFHVAGVVVPAALLGDTAAAAAAAAKAAAPATELAAGRRSKFVKAADAPAPAPAAGSPAAPALEAANLLLLAADAPLLPFDAKLVLAGCHSLIAVLTHAPAPPAPGTKPGVRPTVPPVTVTTVDILGDPMEKAALLAAGWGLPDPRTAPPAGAPPFVHAAPRRLLEPVEAAAAAVVVSSSASAPALPQPPPPPPPPPPPRCGVRIVRRWAFSSDLKRMSAAVALVGDVSELVDGSASGETARFRILTKGAPEVILRCLAKDQLALLPRFEPTLRALAGTGARVLALAWKPVSLPAAAAAAADRGLSAFRALASVMPRVDAEVGLRFAGFLVISSPLKTDTRRTIRELQESNHRVVMVRDSCVLRLLAHNARKQIILYAISISPVRSAGDWRCRAHSHCRVAAGWHCARAYRCTCFCVVVSACAPRLRVHFGVGACVFRAGGRAGGRDAGRLARAAALDVCADECFCIGCRRRLRCRPLHPRRRAARPFLAQPQAQQRRL